MRGHQVSLLTFRNGKDAMPPDAASRLFHLHERERYKYAA